MQKTFYVKALWDEDAKVFVCESDIEGLHIEAETLDEFERLIHEHARELALQNHILNQTGAANLTLADLIPGIVWQRPSQAEPLCA